MEKGGTRIEGNQMNFEIRAYLGRCEGQHFDRKSLLSGRPGEKRPRDLQAVEEQIARYVAGFANAGGGVLLMGVEDGGEVTGHGYFDDVVEELLKVPRERLDPPQEAGFRIRYQGFEFLIFDVDMALEPVMMKGDAYPLRAGDRMVEGSYEMIRGLKQQGLEESYESGWSGLRVEELDQDLLRRARLGAGLGGISDEVYLEKRRLGRWEGSRFRLRRAAELVFCRDAPDGESRGVEVFRVDGKVRSVGARSNVQDVARLRGPISEVLDRSVEVVDKTLRASVPKKWSGNPGVVMEISPFAWKEALLNGLVHRDYGESGRDVEVWIFDDRVEVSSPGSFLSQVQVERLLRKERIHASRNPRIFRALVDLGYMREHCEGIPRVFDEMEALFLPVPEILAATFEVRMRLFNRPVFSERDREFSEAISTLELTMNECRALFAAHREKKVTNRRLRELSRLNSRAAWRVLKGLRERGLLEMQPAGAASHYVLGPGLAAAK